MEQQRYCKRLIEVDLPIKKISEHARREKSIRQGHIATLHIWWARRPLAACRAVLCAALWPDPADSLCPEKFKKESARLMKEFRDKRGGKPKNWSNPIELRESLLDFIADFANWDNSIERDFLEIGRTLTTVAHQSLEEERATKCLVFDPFAGGGSIPFEALRIGADAFASDLNPIPVILNKVIIEYVPKYGNKLANEIRNCGEWINKEIEKKLGSFYPRNPDGTSPIAYLWARTIKCEGPGCGTKIPLMRSLWLAKKGKNSTALRLIPNCKDKKVNFEIISNAKSKDIPEGTVRRTNAICPCCKYTTPAASVKRQLKQQEGGANFSRLIAIRINNKNGSRGYRLPTEKDIEANKKAREELKNKEAIHKGTFSLLPDEPMDQENATLVSGRGYGITKWHQLFTDRQALTLVTIVEMINKIENRLKANNDREFVKAIKCCLALALDRLADFNTSFCVLNVVGGRGVVHTFGRQALPMVWDFMETNPLNEVGANWMSGIEAFNKTINRETVITHYGNIERASATANPLPDDSAHCFFTDPPYYDAIDYATLSDFFYVWLKRTIGNLYPELFKENLTDKDNECIVSLSKGKDRRYFEETMKQAMVEGRRVLSPGGIGVVVFAHKSTAGWEAQLQSMLEAGWVITASWPIDTERGGRLNAIGTASLASSIHLVCRPRENPDGSLIKDFVGDWRDILQELPKRIHEWMPRLAEEGIVGADAIFACLGPALEIFSRFSYVEKANGEKVELKKYLEQVWVAVAKEALNMIFEGAQTVGFEEDSRLTAMWLWTLSTSANGNGKEKDVSNTQENESGSSKAAVSSGFSLEFDAARKIAQGLGAHLEKLSNLIEIKGDKARLLPVSERVKSLFGKDNTTASTYKRKKKENQLTLFDELKTVQEKDWSLGDKKAEVGKTVLDRLHQSMILFGAGRGETLRRFLVEEGVGKDERFWRLAQALSALYPSSTDEKRWVDGVLAKKKSFGF